MKKFQPLENQDLTNPKIHWLTPFLFLVAVLGGLLCVLIPVLIVGVKRYYYSPLCPALRTAIENMQFWPTIIMLFILGVVLGLLNPNRWLVLAISTVVIFPVLSVFEMKVSPSSHNLWPIEFLVYVVLGIPSISGAFIGKYIRRKGVSQ